MSVCAVPLEGRRGHGSHGSGSVMDWVLTFGMRLLAVFFTTDLRTSMKYFVILISVFFVTMKSRLLLNYLMILLPQPPLCWDSLHTPLHSDFPLSFRKGFQILIKSVYFWMTNTIILLCRKMHLYSNLEIYMYVCACPHTSLQCHDNFTDLILLLLLVFHTPYVSIYFLIFYAPWNQTQGSVCAT